MTRSDRLLEVLNEYREVVVIAHNNPDPDAIASGWALVFLVGKKLKKPARLVGRGPILRAENRQFLNLLQPPIELVDAIELDEKTATVLVDCSPTSMNHLLAGKVIPTAVVDHHEIVGKRSGIRFRDIRPKVTASATMTTSYIREQGLEPSGPMATALLYAIRTEMRGAPVALSRLDHSALRWLSNFVQQDMLSRIESPPLPRHYYEELLLALNSVVVYGDCAVCFLPRMSAPETIGEVADLLIRYEGLECVLTGGRAGDDFLLSARSKRTGRSAIDLLHKVLTGFGHFGGHRHRAGGKISVTNSGMEFDDLERELRTRWLNACGSKLRRGQRLVGRKEIT